MKQIFEYLILSLILATMFTIYGYVLTTATMIILYASVYAITEKENGSESDSEENSPN